MFKTTQVRLYPTDSQQHALAFQFGAVRWVYNTMLTWRRDAWRQSRERITLSRTITQLAILKKQAETAWLSNADSQTIQQACRHLDNAYRRFFQRLAQYPRYKHRHGRQSLSYPQRVKVLPGGMLYLPKVGNVKAKLHRPLHGKIKTVTVSRTTTGKYYAAILCDDGQPLPPPVKQLKAGAIVGVDLGLTHLATLSDGDRIANPRHLEQAAANLRRKQKNLSRKVPGSANRAKARRQVAKAHEQVVFARQDYHHKLSKRLIDENQAVCAETLNVRGMLKNRRLAKAIADASWGDLPLATRAWQCGGCGAHHDRDVNAAVNIKQRGIEVLKTAGLSVSACGGMRETRSRLLRLAAACEAGSPVL